MILNIRYFEHGHKLRACLVLFYQSNLFSEWPRSKECIVDVVSWCQNFRLWALISSIQWWIGCHGILGITTSQWSKLFQTLEKLFIRNAKVCKMDMAKRRVVIWSFPVGNFYAWPRNSVPPKPPTLPQSTSRNSIPRPTGTISWKRWAIGAPTVMPGRNLRKNVTLLGYRPKMSNDVRNPPIRISQTTGLWTQRL